jgi:hypothetical protein
VSHINDVIAQHKANLARWGSQVSHTPHEWLGLIAEEAGEAARAANELRWRHDAHACVATGQFDAYRRELVDVAATALGAILALDLRIATGEESGRAEGTKKP